MDCTVLRAALYVRVSTEEQAIEGQSIDAQIETLKQYCQLYKIEVFKIYKDLGISGKAVKNRPGLQEMLKDASENKFDIVLVWKISRLSRSLKDLLMILDQLEKNNIAFSSYSEKFDTSNAVGRMTLQILGSIAEFERNTIVDNVKLGLKEYARKGGKTGTILGYDNIEKQLVINPVEAEIVRLIYRLYVIDRMSMAEIAEFLNSKGYLTKRGKSFRKDSISVILSNPSYIGINRHNVGSYTEYQTTGSHQPLVETEIWKAAQELKGSSKSKRSTRSNEACFLLSGKVVCFDCSSPMIGFYSKVSSKIYRYYKCKSCGKLINASHIEQGVLKTLYNLLQNQQVVMDCLGNYNNCTSSHSHNMQLQQIQRQIKSLNNQLDKYVELLSMKEFENSDIIITKIKGLEEKLLVMKDKMNKLEKSHENKKGELTTSDYQDIIKEVFHNQSSKELKKLFDCLIRKIEYDKTSKLCTITFTFNINEGNTISFVL